MDGLSRHSGINREIKFGNTHDALCHYVLMDWSVRSFATRKLVTLDDGRQKGAERREWSARPVCGTLSILSVRRPGAGAAGEDCGQDEDKGVGGRQYT